MKKAITLCLLSAFMLSASAQNNETPTFECGTFNHLGANLSVGTEGFCIGLAAPCTPYLEFSASVSMTPQFKVNNSGDIVDVNDPEMSGYNYGSTNVQMQVQRTAFDLKANFYPLGGNSAFFLAAGLSMGGGKLIKYNAHSDNVARNPQKQFYTQTEQDIMLAFDKNGNTSDADARVSNVRPYIGLGTGRLVNRGRIGFRAEFGAQFMGKLKYYQYNKELTKAPGSDKAIFEKLSVYPVIRLTLTGRIL